VDEAAGPVEPGTDTGSDTAASAEAQDNPQNPQDPQDQKIVAKGKSNAGSKGKPAQKSAVQKSGAASVVLELPYPSGGSTDYISSLSVAEQQPSLLAIADTQGHISLWDSQACLERRGRCEAIDKPWLGHEGSPVRAVALSADGCFLASAADDGRVTLWALDGQGLRRSSSREGRVLAQGRKPLNAVDVIATRTGVWVSTGSDDGRVALHWVGFQGDRRADGSCPVLSGGGS
jgi:WD40 repeat protein